MKSSKHVFPIVPSASVSLAAAEGDAKGEAWWSDYKRAAILDATRTRWARDVWETE